MSDEWDFFALLVDDEPASIFVDMGIAKSAPVRGFDQMAFLRVRMRSAREDGLSSQEEFDDLIALEDVAIAELVKNASALYVGRNTSSGNRDFYFYTENGRRFEVAGREAMTAFPQYEFEVGTRSDPQWKTYFEFLYPSPVTRQIMANRAVMDNLAKHGDRADEPREIDHFAVFRSAAGCDAFSRHVKSIGFKIADGSPRAEADGLHLAFSKIDRVIDIDAVTITLFEAAVSNDGDYDGWGCPVVSSETGTGTSGVTVLN